jgi:hypothetical protein
VGEREEKELEKKMKKERETGTERLRPQGYLSQGYL